MFIVFQVVDKLVNNTAFVVIHHGGAKLQVDSPEELFGQFIFHLQMVIGQRQVVTARNTDSFFIGKEKSIAGEAHLWEQKIE